MNADNPNITQEEHLEWNILRRIGSIGILWNRASDAWLGIGGLKASDRNIIFEKLYNKGKIIKVIVDGIEENFYCLSEDRSLIEIVLNSDNFMKRTEFIAPLDNMLWDRKLINKIFDFEYKWEIYTPITQRKYGYYVLPILSGDSFVGRIEVINDRKSRRLIVKNFWLENADYCYDGLNENIIDCIRRFARFNDCKDIKFERKTRNGIC